MSLYNSLFGTNPLGPALKDILEIDVEGGISSGRFRDIRVDETGEKIILYTRNGGGNRECYEGWEYGESGCKECEDSDICLPHKISILRTHPNYIRDYDDDFDCTYAYFEFSVPDDYKDAMKLLSIKQGKPITISEKFSWMTEEMANMTKDELMEDQRFKPIIEILEKIGQSLHKR